MTLQSSEIKINGLDRAGLEHELDVSYEKQGMAPEGNGLLKQLTS